MKMIKYVKMLTVAFAIFIMSDGGTKVSAQVQKDVEIASTYYQQGEFGKAVDIYKKLAKKPANIKLIHKEYFSSLISLKEYAAADRYVNKTIRSFPNEMLYRVDYGQLLQVQKKLELLSKHFEALREEKKSDLAAMRYISVHMLTYGLYAEAEKTLLVAKKKSKQDFDIELAEVYQLWGKHEQMVERLLSLLTHDRAKSAFVQSELSDKLSEDQFLGLEEELIGFAQRNSTTTVFNEMLIWYYLQLEDYNMAYLQSRTVDRRLGKNGTQVLAIGQMAFDNHEYEIAIKIFEYITQKYKRTSSYQRARTLSIQAREALAKEKYPVDIDMIKRLAADYESVIDEIGVTAYTADAVRNLALLEAFYLSNKDKAVESLVSLIKSPRIPSSVVAETKLVLGDIYLLKDEPWEASLIYSQVEKSQKNTPLGHDAKLRNAKLSYYMGDFELAKGHLDVLKMATSREIANDAMDLSLLIQDNLELDTSATAMILFASIDLLDFQNKIYEALAGYDTMLAVYDDHTLTDEILWEKAQLLMKLGRFADATDQLLKIITDFTFDIVADDANFLLGEINEKHLHNKEKAMEYYQAQFTKPEYGGSLYIVEARKRFRKLRGDKVY